MKRTTQNARTFNFGNFKLTDTHVIAEFLSGVELKGSDTVQAGILESITSVSYENLESLIKTVQPHVRNLNDYKAYCLQVRENEAYKPYI